MKEKVNKREKPTKILSLDATFYFSLISIGSCSFAAWVNSEEVIYLTSDECCMALACLYLSSVYSQPDKNLLFISGSASNISLN